MTNRIIFNTINKIGLVTTLTLHSREASDVSSNDTNYTIRRKKQPRVISFRYKPVINSKY